MKTPQEFHWSEHAAWGDSFEDCWSCNEARTNCRSKVRFASSWVATQRAQEIEDLYGNYMTTYHCRWCLNWHLTSKAATFRNTKDRARMREWQRRRRAQAQDL